MGYYMAGDYYAAGGILGNIWGGIKGAVGGFVSGGPAGAIKGAVSGALGTGKQQNVGMAIPFPTSGLPVIKNIATSVQPVPGIVGAAQRLVPGGASGYQVVMRKRKRMNVANPRALRRAIRREQGFVKLARRALKGTGYTVATRGSRKRSLNVRESGPGSVIVR